MTSRRCNASAYRHAAARRRVGRNGPRHLAGSTRLPDHHRSAPKPISLLKCSRRLSQVEPSALIPRNEAARLAAVHEILGLRFRRLKPARNGRADSRRSCARGCGIVRPIRRLAGQHRQKLFDVRGPRLFSSHSGLLESRFELPLKGNFFGAQSLKKRRPLLGPAKNSVLLRPSLKRQSSSRHSRRDREGCRTFAAPARKRDVGCGERLS